MDKHTEISLKVSVGSKRWLKFYHPHVGGGMGHNVHDMEDCEVCTAHKSSVTELLDELLRDFKEVL